MYNLLFVLLIGAALLLSLSGYQRRSLPRLAGGIGLAVLTVAFFWLMGFWANMLWFDALGYQGRFWKAVIWQVSTLALGILLGWTGVWLLTFGIPRSSRRTRMGSRILGAVLGGLWGMAYWETAMVFFHRITTGVTEPILSKGTGFYLFALPFYDALYHLGFQLAVIGFLAVLLALFFRINPREGAVEFKQLEDPHPPFGRLYANAAVLLVILAFGKFLDRYHLMYSAWGVVTGPGWTDAMVRLPAYLIAFAITLLAGIVLVVPPLRERIREPMHRFTGVRGLSHLFTVAVAGGFILAVWFVALGIAPGLFQWLRVEPNEISFEEYYISENIRFTRQGFGLHRIEEKEFPAGERFTQAMARKNQAIFDNIRLWDWRALDAVYKQFQEIRLYYEFADVDIDRYWYNEAYRQVMISAREMEIANLPEQSQTFVNRRFKYTHGYGITLTNVSEFTPQGLPNLLVRDIPPKSKYPELQVQQPRIYYGELSDSHVVVNSQEAEFDYPSGDKNQYSRYDGTGGVRLSNLWRKFIFGWVFDGTRFFLSGYPTQESRVLFHRQIQERVEHLAPFLRFDRDPYVVLADGKLYWIIDGYTSSEYYPYSEPFDAEDMLRNPRARQENLRTLFNQKAQKLEGINYIRNSVKAVVNAHDGTVDFYVFEPDDPIIRVWQRIYPRLFQSKAKMPEKLRRHVRYPSDLLLVQGLVYAKYHMTDPAVFYNQEDLWIRATEKYYDWVQPVQPYYIMWKHPQAQHPEFVLIQPFTPKNRQVLIGWIAGMCDGSNYGRLLAYKFPKEKRVLGTQQVETKIDQDRFLSGQLTLWDQRGSNVIRGNVLAIPVEDTLLYVEPIYLQAETAAYPELRLVVIMHDDQLSYAETFDKALRGLLEGGKKAAGLEPMPGITQQELIDQAQQAFADYLRLTGEKRFDRAAGALKQLEQALGKLSETKAKQHNPSQ